MSMRNKVEISLTLDQAIVLSDWLDRVMHQPAFTRVVDDRAVWSPLLRISGSLETTLSEVFDPQYADKLAEAKRRLLADLGEFGT